MSESYILPQSIVDAIFCNIEAVDVVAGIRLARISRRYYGMFGIKVRRGLSRQGYIVRTLICNNDKVEVWENPLLPEKYIRWAVSQGIVNWDGLSNNRNPLIVDIFHENLNSLNWENISMNESLPVEFFREHVHLIDWYHIGWNYTLPTEFFREYADKLNWEVLSNNPAIPIDLLDKYIENLDWGGIARNTSIPIEFIESHIDQFETPREWKKLSKNLCKRSPPPIEFMKRHESKISWYDISFMKKIPIEVADHFEHQLEDHIWRRIK